MAVSSMLQIFSWALYDLANQFFVLNIVSLYFVRWVTIEKGLPEFFYSIAFSLSAFFVSVFAPFLGTISDLLNKRMPFLISFTLLSVAFTIILGIQENPFLALLFFAVANFGCQIAAIFYNALLTNIAPQNKIGFISGIGRMFSYCGALLALYLIKPLVLKSGYKAALLPSGILFFIFALPCMVFIKDKNHGKAKVNLPSCFTTLKLALFSSDKLPGLADFLKVAFFGLCTVNVITVFMSAYVTHVFKLNETQLVHLVSFSTLFAILGSFISGFISDRIGAGKSLILVFVLWMFCLFLGALAGNNLFYWLTGAFVGATLGATWVILRSLVVQLVPGEKTGEVFGLFNLVGYLSAGTGVVFWGIILFFLQPLGATGYRIALLSLNTFLFLGLLYLRRIKYSG